MQVINVWRTATNATKILDSYCALYGQARAQECGRVLPQRPLRCRWMTKQHTEAYLLRCGPSEVPAVYVRALGGSTHTADARKAPRSVAAPDAQTRQAQQDLGILDADETPNRARLGRWTREALHAFGNNAFWIRLNIGHISASPCGHFQVWIHPGGSERPNIVELVCGKASNFMTEWEALLQPEAFSSPHWGNWCASSQSCQQQSKRLGPALPCFVWSRWQRTSAGGSCPQTGPSRPCSCGSSTARRARVATRGKTAQQTC